MKTNLLQRLKKITTTIPFLLVISLTGCFHSFYSTNTKTTVDSNTVSKLVSEQKYFIVHFLNTIKPLENVYTNDDSIYGKIIELPSEHSKYLKPAVNDKLVRVKVNDMQYTLSEVHLYTNEETKPGDSLFAANLSSFYRTDVYEFNKGATSGNHIWSAVGLSLVFLFGMAEWKYYGSD